MSAEFSPPSRMLGEIDDHGLIYFHKNAPDPDPYGFTDTLRRSFGQPVSIIDIHLSCLFIVHHERHYD